jgi:hypothetical protein
MNINMRFLLPALALLLSFASPGSAQLVKKAPKAAVATCKNRCSVQYNFCKKRATTKLARRSCVETRKNCKGQCGG